MLIISIDTIAEIVISESDRSLSTSTHGTAAAPNMLVKPKVETNGENNLSIAVIKCIYPSNSLICCCFNFQRKAAV